MSKPSDHDALLQLGDHIHAVIDHARMSGHLHHNGQSAAWMFHAVQSAFDYLIAAEYVQSNPDQEEKINQTVQQSPYGYAAIDIPRDNILCAALTLACVFIERQGHNKSGTDQTRFAINRAIRTAARMVHKIENGHLTANIKALCELTDTEIEKLEANAQLYGLTPEGNS